jgi:uncharacterized protein YqfB (UPF0267 family)
LLLLLQVRFESGLSSDEIAISIERVRRSIQEIYPSVKQIYIEPQAED